MDMLKWYILLYIFYYSITIRRKRKGRLIFLGTNFLLVCPDHLVFSIQVFDWCPGKAQSFIMIIKSLPISDQCCYCMLTVLDKALSIYYSIFIHTATQGGRCPHTQHMKKQRLNNFPKDAQLVDDGARIWELQDRLSYKPSHAASQDVHPKVICTGHIRS